MRKRTMAVALALAVAACSAVGGTREENLQQLATIYTESAGDMDSLNRRSEEFLATLAPEDAFTAQADLYGFAARQGVISQREYANEMLKLNKRYTPQASIPIDFWGYVAMIAAKRERDEISEEEFLYLREKKHTEAVAAQARVRDEARATAEVEAANLAAQKAWREQQDADAIGGALQAIGAALLRRNQPGVNCLTTGNVTSCR